MLNKVIELATEFWATIFNIANWTLTGTWYEIIFTLLGITGAMFTVQQIHFRLRDSSVLVAAVTKIAMLAATLFWLLLMIAVALIAFDKY